MRVSRAQVAENKRKLLEAAGQLFKMNGFEAVTVNDVMKSAGLTYGGFYSYFESKDDLISQTLANLKETAQALPTDMAVFAEQYLSLAHKDNFARGCSVAALAPESVRQNGKARLEMTVSLKAQYERLSEISPGASPHDKREAAIGIWSAMVGALILARASNDPKLSQEILDSTRRWIVR